MDVRAWIAVAVCALGAAGCGAPAAVMLPTPSPRAEALAWFPDGSLAVALVATDPEDPGVRRMLGALVEAVPAAAAGAPALEQLRPVLGHDLAVGVVAPGQAPLGVLVARDGGTLAALAEAQVNGGRAAPAGSYLGADLYAAEGHAFGVRHDVLLLSTTTAALRAALDRRATEDGTEEADLPRAPDAHMRAVVDLRPLVARAGERARAIPWLAAARRLAVTVHAGDMAAVARVAVDTGARELLDHDVPITPDRRGPRTVDVPEPRVAVRDLAHVLGVAERAAGTAAPLALVRLGLALRAGRRLASALHGPATLVVRNRRRLLLRADPSHPDRIEAGVARLARALPRAGLRVRRVRRGFYETAGVRFGVARGRVVAGRAPVAALRRLARAPLARPAGSRGSLAFAVPGHRLTGWASATPDGIDAELRLAWP